MDLTGVAALLASFAGAVAIGLMVIAIVSYTRRRNPVHLFLVAAFALFATKNILVALSMTVFEMKHDHLWIAETLLDLAVITLLVLPFFLRR